MAPLRRYLRITPYSILEVRIYLDNPADLNRWLLHPSKPILSSILAAVKPLILPKLREENARASGRKVAGTAAKPKGKKGVRDVISTDDFEVSIFLTELSTPHSVLVRTREFTTATEPKDGDGPGTREVPITVAEGDSPQSSPDFEDTSIPPNIPGRSDKDDNVESQAEGEANDDAISVASNDDSSNQGEDEKKKLALNTRYDGFQIYGRILCLVVKRKDLQKQQQKTSLAARQRQTGKEAQGNIAEMVSKQNTGSSSAIRQGQGIMEGWMRSTQAIVVDPEETGDQEGASATG